MAGGREEKARRVSLAKALCNQKLDSLSEFGFYSYPFIAIKKALLLTFLQEK